MKYHPSGNTTKLTKYKNKNQRISLPHSNVYIKTYKRTGNATLLSVNNAFYANNQTNKYAKTREIIVQ